jgi:hypothetical protein
VALTRELRHARLKWFVFGAQALVARGLPRATQDLDLTVDAGELDAPKLLRVLGRAGLTLRHALDDDFVEQTRVLPMLHAASSLPVDVVLAGPGLEQAQLARAQTCLLARTPVPVIELNDLVVVKVLAGRGKDLEDVASLLRARPAGLSVEVIRARLREIEQALDDSTLVRQFDALQTREG